MPIRRGGEKQRSIQLDILRGAAILLVLGDHWVIHPDHAGRFRPLAQALSNIGWTGVVLFFVLSGFLIGGLLMQEIQTYGRLDVQRFLVRRAFKIWPAYYLYLAFLFVAIGLRSGGRWGHALHVLKPNLVHLQNYTYHQPVYAGHTWSLAIEEHFYLVLPFLLVFLASTNRKRLDWIPWIALALTLVCLGLRLMHHGQVFHTYTIQNPTHFRVDSLFAGVMLAYWYHFRPDLFASLARRRGPLLVVGLLFVLPAAIFRTSKTEFMWTFGYTMVSIGCACLLVFLVTTQPGQGGIGGWLTSRSARTLAFIGTFSYSIYIWHPDLVQLPIQNLCTHGFLHGISPTVRWLCMTLVTMIASIIVGILLGKLVEMPALAIRNRLFPSRASALGNK